MRLRPLSIRARITVGATVIAFILLVVAGFIVYGQIERIVRSGEEAVLAGIEAPYVTAIEQDSSEELDMPGKNRLVLVTDANGDTRLDTMPAPLATELIESDPARDHTREVTVDGRTYLVRAEQVDTPDGAWTVYAARDFQRSAEILDGVAVLLGVAMTVIASGFAAAAWFTTTAALRPVTRLQRNAERLAERPRGDLLPTGPAHDEIDALAHTLNVLIVRTRESAEREREIVSNASHELRTPLAILNTQLEVAMSPDISETQLRSDIAAARTTLQRLIRIAQGLLDLSRAEAQHVRGAGSFDELAQETADAAERARIRFRETGADIDYTIETSDGETGVAITRHDFGRVLDNLLSNAISAARAGVGPHVLVSLRQSERETLVAVADRSGGMPPAFVPRAFERFSRAADVGYPGGGLGLSIVATIVANAGGTISLDNRPDDGLTVQIRLPNQPRPEEASA